MFNPEKDFNSKVIECLGKEGLSISSLGKELEKMGIKHHRLIITGYLRALTDMNILRERDVPPSKIYIPIKSVEHNIYNTVEKNCRTKKCDTDELILYTLNKLFHRPIFESELRMCGVSRSVGSPVDEQSLAESKKLLKRQGNVVPSELGFVPINEYPEEYCEVLASIVIENNDSSHLILETKQTKLI